MIRVLKFLLKVWPGSVNAKTEKESDVLACVDMAGRHHPTKDKVIQLLQEAKCRVDEHDQQVVDTNTKGCNAALATLDGDGHGHTSEGDDSVPSKFEPLPTETNNVTDFLSGETQSVEDTSNWRRPL